MSEGSRSITRDQVDQWVAHEIDGDSLVASTEERPWGFTVMVQSRAFIETGDVFSMLVGSGPYIIDGSSGEVWQTGSAPTARLGRAPFLGWADLTDQASFEQWRWLRPPGTSNVLDVEDPDGAGERLIQRYARWRGMHLPFADDGDFGWSDMEVGRLIAPAENSDWAFISWERGVRQEKSRFSTREDALRALLIELASIGFQRRFIARNPALDVHEYDVDGKPALQWGDRHAVFRGSRDRERFRPFLRAAMPDIAASFAHPSGHPLLILEK